MTAPAARLAAALADRYRLERELGHGGMATVFLAQDLKHDRRSPSRCFGRNSRAAIGAERFLREIRIAAQLQHPHILTLIDSGAVPAADERVRRCCTTSCRSSTASAAAAARPRDGASRRGIRSRSCGMCRRARLCPPPGIAHRDIKPENIMLAGRHALVMDFGIAKAIAAGGTVSPAAGTRSPRWASPSARRPTWRRSRPRGRPRWTLAPISTRLASSPTRC